MFKAKYFIDRNIYQVLDTTIDPITGETIFLIWYQEKWHWIPSRYFVPPNVDIKEKI